MSDERRGSGSGSGSPDGDDVSGEFGTQDAGEARSGDAPTTPVTPEPTVHETLPIVPRQLPSAASYFGEPRPARHSASAPVSAPAADSGPAPSSQEWLRGEVPDAGDVPSAPVSGGDGEPIGAAAAATPDDLVEPAAAATPVEPVTPPAEPAEAAGRLHFAETAPHPLALDLTALRGAAPERDATLAQAGSPETEDTPAPAPLDVGALLHDEPGSTPTAAFSAVFGDAPTGSLPVAPRDDLAETAADSAPDAVVEPSFTEIIGLGSGAAPVAQTDVAQERATFDWQSLPEPSAVLTPAGPADVTSPTPAEPGVVEASWNVPEGDADPAASEISDEPARAPEPIAWAAPIAIVPAAVPTRDDVAASDGPASEVDVEHDVRPADEEPDSTADDDPLAIFAPVLEPTEPTGAVDVPSGDAAADAAWADEPQTGSSQVPVAHVAASVPVASVAPVASPDEPASAAEVGSPEFEPTPVPEDETGRAAAAPLDDWDTPTVALAVPPRFADEVAQVEAWPIGGPAADAAQADTAGAAEPAPESGTPADLDDASSHGNSQPTTASEALSAAGSDAPTARLDAQADEAQPASPHPDGSHPVDSPATEVLPSAATPPAYVLRGPRGPRVKLGSGDESGAEAWPETWRGAVPQAAPTAGDDRFGDGGGGFSAWPRGRRILVAVIVALVFIAVLVAIFFGGRALAGGTSSGAAPALVPTASAPVTPSTTPSAAPAPSATPTPSATPATGPATVGTHQWSDLRGGECLSSYQNAWQQTYDVSDCATPHVAQMVASGTLDGAAGSAYPGMDALQAQVGLKCSASTAIDFGKASAYSDVQVAGSFPSDDAQWAAGARTYYCFVSRSSGQTLSGSVAAG